MRFEWDDQKALENVEKHGVTFGEATEVFYDPNALEDYDADLLGRRGPPRYHWAVESAIIVRSLRGARSRLSTDYLSAQSQSGPTRNI